MKGSTSPLAKSHSLAEWSEDAEMRYMESEEKTQSHTQRECFTSVFSSSHVTLLTMLSRRVEVLLDIAYIHLKSIHRIYAATNHKIKNTAYILLYIRFYFIHSYLHTYILCKLILWNLTGDEDSECPWEAAPAVEEDLFQTFFTVHILDRKILLHIHTVTQNHAYIVTYIY